VPYPTVDSNLFFFFFNVSSTLVYGFVRARLLECVIRSTTNDDWLSFRTAALIHGNDSSYCALLSSCALVESKSEFECECDCESE